MFKSNVSTDAETYFASINSMAKRIVMDTVALQSGLGEKWNNLNYPDRCDIVTKGILKPALSEKYPNIGVTDDSCFPKLNVTSGQKYVFEEENASRNKKANSWRDEHSGPFIWESQSQLNLSYILQDHQSESSTPDNFLPNKEAKETLSAPEETSSAESNGCVKDKVVNKAEVEGLTAKTTHKKKPAPPIPIQSPENVSDVSSKEQTPEFPQELTSPISTNSETETLEEKIIPKTGFDFLDNW